MITFLKEVRTSGDVVRYVKCWYYSFATSIFRIVSHRGSFYRELRRKVIAVFFCQIPSNDMYELRQR